MLLYSFGMVFRYLRGSDEDPYDGSFIVLLVIRLKEVNEFHPQHTGYISKFYETISQLFNRTRSRCLFFNYMLLFNFNKSQKLKSTYIYTPK